MRRRRGWSWTCWAGDDELRSVHAFLDRSAAAGMAALVLEGEAGIGKSTLWLAGVEAARERGLRVPLVSARRGRAGVRPCRAGRPARGGTRGSGRRAGSPASSCARDRVAAPGGRGRAGRLPDARRGCPQRAAHARRAPADPARGRRRPVAGRAVENRLRSRCARTATIAAHPPRWERHRGARARAALDSDSIERRYSRPDQSRRAARDPATAARPVVREADAAAPPRSRWRNHSSRSSSRASSARTTIRRAPLVPETLESLVRARLDGLPDETRRAFVARLHDGRAHAGTAGRRGTRARLRRPRDRARGRSHPFHAPAARLSALPGSFAGRTSAHEQLAEIVDDPLARVRHRALLRLSRTRRWQRSWRWRPTSRPHAALRSPRQSSGSTPWVRRPRVRPGTATGERSPLHAPTSPRGRSSSSGDRLELLADAPAGTARAEALALLAELEGAQRGVELLEEALGHRRATPRSRRCCTGGSVSRASHEGDGVGSEPCADRGRPR